MQNQIPEVKSLSDFQIKEAYSNLSKELQRKPTLSELDKALKSNHGVSASRVRLVDISHQIDRAAQAVVNALPAELSSSLNDGILAFVNQQIESHTKSLNLELDSAKAELADAAKEIEGHEVQLQVMQGRLESTLESSRGLSALLDVRDDQIFKLQVQLEAKETASASVYAQQIEQKIEENFKLRDELEAVKQRFIAELTTLVGVARANQFLEPAADAAEKTPLAS